MKEINVNDNMVCVDGFTFQIDCSSLAAKSIVYIGEDSQGLFAEKNPFKGKVYKGIDTDVDVAAIVQQAVDLLAEQSKPLEEVETLDEAKLRIIGDINQAYTDELTPLVEEYPEIETKTWSIQNKEATDYLNWVASGSGDKPATPLLDNILIGRNEDGGVETLQQLCEAVLINAQSFSEVQILTGRRQRLVKLVQGATTKDEVYAIQWIN